MKTAWFLAVTVLLLAAGPAFAQMVKENPLGLALEREAPETVSPGASFDVVVTLRAEETGSIGALGVIESLPEGFIFTAVDGVDGSEAPPVYQFDEDENRLEFAWITVPGLPYSFQYTLSAPADISGLYEISGYIEYRTSGGALQSETAVSELRTPDTNAPPGITLLGDNPLQWLQGVPYVDPGWVASDAEDGDLTDAVVLDGIVAFMAPGTYTVTYYVEDSAGAAATAAREVVVIEQPCKGPLCCAGGDGPRFGWGADLLVMALAVALLAVRLLPGRSPH